jgi:hypothetical protein
MRTFYQRLISHVGPIWHPVLLFCKPLIYRIGPITHHAWMFCKALISRVAPICHRLLVSHNVLVCYILLSLGLMASLWLFLSLKREIRAHAHKHGKRMEEMAEQLRKTPEPVPRPEFLAWDPPAPRAGFNLHKRVHAMRMLRRGEDLAHIAAALGVTRREVELLIRVHKLTAAKTAGA